MTAGALASEMTAYIRLNVKRGVSKYTILRYELCVSFDTLYWNVPTVC